MACNVDEAESGQNERNCYSKRTCMEKCEIVLLVIAILVIAGLVVVLVLFLTHQGEMDQSHKDLPESEKPDICTTPDCIQTASLVLKYMNESVNPCDDFYQFSCGGYLQETKIPDDKTQINSFITASNEVQQQLRIIIEEPIKGSDPRPFKLLKNLYRMCMNTRAIETDTLPTFKIILDNLGGWPVIEGKAWNEKDFDWQKSTAKSRQYGLMTSSFLAISVQADSRNSSRNVVMLDQADLEISRETSLNGFEDPIAKAYHNYMVNLSVYFGAERGFAEYEMNTMLEFRRQLAMISLPSEKRRNETALYNPMSIKELQEGYSNISWLELLNSVIGNPNRNLTEEDIVIVFVPEFLRGLVNLIPKTSKRVLANHMMCQTVRSVVSLLPEAVRKLKQEFNAVIYGSQTQPPKWDECTSIASEAFPLAASALYVRKYFDEDSKMAALEMVSDIKREFINILKEVDWMDESTRVKAIDKAKTMTTHIAYADELLNDKKLEEYYAPLTFNGNNYLYFMTNISVFEFDKKAERLWQPVNKTDWTQRAPPTLINAFYSLTENSIQFPSAILQGLFFNKNRLRSMNYGAIGTIIGHEITHGFDDQGKQYDQKGNLNNWWAEKTDRAFMDRAECIIDQYSKHSVPEVRLYLNGINTQGENIADNGGIKEAYLAYSSWVKIHGEEPQLPALNYTAKQLFWISTANVWCAKDRVQSLTQDVLVASHAPAPYRVIVPFSNSEYFAKDFNCPLGSKMNPRHKCKVW